MSRRRALRKTVHRAWGLTAPPVAGRVVGRSSSLEPNSSAHYCDMMAPDSLRYEKPKSLDLSNQLAANSTTESESVDVEWIID